VNVLICEPNCAARVFYNFTGADIDLGDRAPGVSPH
jgi:hypothetical protein